MIDLITLILLDVDGVLTDGSVILDKDGEEIKNFSVRDGLAIKMLMENEIRVGIITGRKSAALSHRLTDLNVEIVYQGVKDKINVYEKILKEYELEDYQVCYMGDDLPDIPVLKKVGLAACPKDAVEEVKVLAHFCSQKRGGRGCVRDLAEFILKSQGKWPKF